MTPITAPTHFPVTVYVRWYSPTKGGYAGCETCETREAFDRLVQRRMPHGQGSTTYLCAAKPAAAEDWKRSMFDEIESVVVFASDEAWSEGGYECHLQWARHAAPVEAEAQKAEEDAALARLVPDAEKDADIANAAVDAGLPPFWACPACHTSNLLTSGICHGCDRRRPPATPADEDKPRACCDNLTTFCDECAEARLPNCATCLDTGFGGDGCPACGSY